MTDKWVRDTGLVFALVFLLLGWRGSHWWLAAAAAFLLALMFAPALIRPLAWAWLKLTHALGFVMNKVFFGVIFFAIITPIGILWRIIGGDKRYFSRQNSALSAFVERSGGIGKKDLEYPY
jgi:hypothetical protein